MPHIIALKPIAMSDAQTVRDNRRNELIQSAHELATEIGQIETDEDKLSVLMGLGALVAEVAALATWTD